MATKVVTWNTGSGNITLTYQGQGNGTITVQSDANDIGSARSQVVTVQTVGGAVTRNLTVSQAACPFPVGDVKSYSYTGSYQEVELPAGQYKLQCWGAQGGSNASASSYGITEKAGGKGGYSEGVLTLTSKTTVRIYVGGAGSSSAGGFNGGGSTSGSASYSSGDTQGVSRMGGGGGATDIRLSDGALLSRMIVAGGGSGGAYCYKKVTTQVQQNIPFQQGDFIWYLETVSGKSGYYWNSGTPYIGWYGIDVSQYRGCNFTLQCTSLGNASSFGVYFVDSSPSVGVKGAYLSEGAQELSSTGTITGTIPSNAGAMTIPVRVGDIVYGDIHITITSSSTTTDSNYKVGYVGGGTTGVAYSSTYQGKQNSAGSGGSFGQGANQTATNHRYCSGAGGGGWYGGGGGKYSDSSMAYCKYSGGGSGFVNTAASAGNRPSGYTGLELDSGTTYAGNTSFPSTSGGTETGHSGNGYAKITRLS